MRTLRLPRLALDPLDEQSPLLGLYFEQLQEPDKICSILVR